MNTKEKNAIIITPPLMQLNSPYPSGAYLTSFFKKLGFKTKWHDLSIELFYSIFSEAGLKKLFSKSEKAALAMADNAAAQGDEATAFNIRRYISTKDSWITWIDTITAILCSGRPTTSGAGYSGREKEHQFLYSPFAPRGARMENFLSTLDHDPTTDDVRFLCTYALADLADYITAVFDPQFSLIRYAEALTVDERTFSDIEKQIDSPILQDFYLPVLEREFGRSRGGATCGAPTPVGLLLQVLAPKEDKQEEGSGLSATIPNAESSQEGSSSSQESPIIVCISVPFAGTFLSALYTARYFKQTYGKNVLVGIGGGFVNTELREVSDKSLGKYIDFISYDRGYGSFNAYFTALNSPAPDVEKILKSGIYKIRQFTPEGIIPPKWHDKDAEKYESEMTVKNTPDYTDIDFSRYPRLCDDRNPMHRIWSDGAWIKAYLAHGCYWAKCAFCDTQLDYVCGYKITDIENLFNSLLKTANEKGVYGIHFVDEALPPAALVKFALLNARNHNPLYYWGNVRFEKSFTKDLAAFLSYCGLGGVSAGLEVATGEGLAEINKGTDLESIVSACAAFKEAGILVHAYMIYGFWNDTAQSIIDSMETLRQFFAAGLLDSSFWHKFVLTKNSTVYAKWEKEGKLHMVSGNDQSSCFAKNNLHFKGEEKYNKFGAPLDAAVNAWMHGQNMETKVQKWFDYPVPQPTISKHFIEELIENYEEKSEKIEVDYTKENAYKGPFWLGGNPIATGNKIRWIYLQEECELKVKGDKSQILTILENLKPESEPEQRAQAILELKNSPEMQKMIEKLHNRGIVFI